LIAVFLLLAAVQNSVADGRGGPPLTPSTRSVAARAALPLSIDGRDQDDVWRDALPISEFFEFEPNEGKAARYRTEAKVAYDHRNLYVFVRMFDAEPDKILRLLSRRDVRTASDQIKLLIDSYHDRRSGYEFAVNPAGVKRDYAIYDDRHEDEAWDGLWDVATTVDSLGWTAEFRIPLSQLRYPEVPSNTFGCGIWRDIERHKERVSWPLYRRNQAGLVSQLGEISGLAGLPAPRRLEVSPYLVTRSVTQAEPGGYSHPQRLSVGADFKYGIASNLTLDGTLNPDFGQVEADPAVLNLSAFETLFQEKRPFFIEGAGLLRVDVKCSVVNCNGEGLFYSRRVGRSPQLRELYGSDRSPTSSTILGAAKLTGRTPSGFSIGVLDAVTEREHTPGGQTIEPAANYAVVRANQDFRKGETSAGAILTSVVRDNDSWTGDYLRSSAHAGGLDFRHRFAGGRYQVQAKVLASRVTGSSAAIAATQRSSVHHYQRPDGRLDYDSTRTTLGGDTQQLRFGKLGGGLVQFETSYQRVSAGFEINDLGFLTRADWQEQATWGSLNFHSPALFFRKLFLNLNQWQQWTSRGQLLDRGINANVHTGLRNNWWLHAGSTLGGFGEVFCDRCSRGGPALRTDRIASLWGGIESDDRSRFRPSVWFNWWSADGGRTRFLGVEPWLRIRASSRGSVSAGIRLEKNRDDRQWYGNFVDQAGTSHYTFARLDQTTRSIVTRFDHAFTTNLTLQGYGQAFVSKGRYRNVRELADPTAARYEDRFQPYAAVTDAGEFNFMRFRSNLVLRWEYRLGSVIYLVWQQGREGNDTAEGGRSFGGDLERLLRSHPTNTLLLKMSYWFDR